MTIVWVCMTQVDSNDSELFQTKLAGKGLVTETYKSLSAITGFSELY